MSENETPAPVSNVEPVAWRWSFDGCQMTWHYATTKPGKFRFGDPDTIQPLYAAPPAPVQNVASAFRAGFELSDKVAWRGGWAEAYSKWSGNSAAHVQHNLEGRSQDAEPSSPP